MKNFLFIPSMIVTKTMYHQTYCTAKDSAYQKLNHSISALKDISNESNEILILNMNYFQSIKNGICLTGRISKNHLNVNFSCIKNLDQLNNFNEELIPSENIRHHFINIVISLINNIFKSIPEEDIEISNKSSNFLMNWLNKNNQNLITISVTHKYSTEISFDCYLAEDSNNIVKISNPNEAGEEEEPLLDKKQK